MRRCWIASVIILAAVAWGCGEGGLATIPSFGDESALAVGGTATVRVESGGSCASVDRAESTDNRFARVTDIRGCEFDLEGRAAGRTSVDIEAEGGATTLDVRTADPHHSLIQHRCTDELTATYLTGQKIDLRYELFDGADNRLWGDVFAVEVSDETLVEVVAVEPGESIATLAAGAQTGQLELAPQGTDPSVTLELVEPAALDGLDLEVLAGGDTVDPGQSASSSPRLGLRVTAREGRRRVCNWGKAGFDLTLTSRTPSICSVGDTAREADTQLTKTINTGDEPLYIWVLGDGTCELAAELDGQGVGDASGDLSFDVSYQ